MDLSAFLHPFSRGRHAGSSVDAAASDKVFDQYESRAPDWQNAIDLVPGWSSSFPPELGLKAGPLALYSDARIAWAMERFGPLRDKDILEVGPLEGMHTFMLNGEAPRKIDAVEANRFSYIRCLIASQILKIDRASFRLGDALEWLERYEGRYDFIVASGVLYHMEDPARFLELVAERTDALFLWTHYFLPEIMPEADGRRAAFSGKEEVKTVRGQRLRLYERNYHRGNNDPAFCGGPRDRHYWMHKDDLLGLLNRLGFGMIEIADDDAQHPGGPCFSVLARRS